MESGDLKGIVGRAVAARLAEIRHLAPPDLPTCRHEIGHALVGILVGDGRLFEVVVADGGGRTMRAATVSSAPAVLALSDELERLGIVSHEDEARLILGRVARSIVSTYGGMATDARGDGQPLWCVRPDLSQIDRLAAAVVPRAARHDFLVALRAVADSAVRDAAPWIEDLARVLQEERRLTGEAIEGYLAAQPRIAELQAYYARWLDRLTQNALPASMARSATPLPSRDD